MNAPLHDPLAVLTIATCYSISEHLAEAAMNLAAVTLVDAWQDYARQWGLNADDSEAMEMWGQMVDNRTRQALVEDAVRTVTAAQFIGRHTSRRSCRTPRVMRTSRPRVHIR
ncbi:hypothetical protein [Streptomyces halobius]|uniref:Uncharacterized protein n=1 Tax=Streptomyces halobius TaxID=2879846 RepID=A0ABY4M961_9ACTN|nr:hypothetical protein [Streptomyces halobius]UQA93673.1 hypothetical protein K9S39_19035 [Streptomyces halobius]